MPLRGELKEFGLPEIFQLLEQQGKTGCLCIRTDTKDVEVYFREGKVVGALPGGEDPWDHLVGILCRVGYLSEEDVRKLAKRQDHDLTSVREILRGETLLGPRQIEVLLREHIEELLFPVFRRRKGEFDFVQDKSLPSDWELREPMDPEPLVLEGLRKTDEWPLLKKRIGSFQEVPQRRIAFREAERLPWKKRLGVLWKRIRGQGVDETLDVLEEDSLLAGEPSLSSAERAVYSLIDGRRNLEEIIHASLLGEFSACQAFLSLLDRGWIRSGGHTARSARPPRFQAARGEKERANLIRGALVLSGAVVLLLSIQVVTHGPQEKRLSLVPIVSEPAPFCRLLNHGQRERVLQALDMYKKEKGHYPEQLTDLVLERLLRPGDLSVWGSNRFSYLVKPDGEYQLMIAPIH